MFLPLLYHGVGNNGPPLKAPAQGGPYFFKNLRFESFWGALIFSRNPGNLTGGALFFLAPAARKTPHFPIEIRIYRVQKTDFFFRACGGPANKYTFMYYMHCISSWKGENSGPGTQFWGALIFFKNLRSESFLGALIFSRNSGNLTGGPFFFFCACGAQNSPFPL